MTQRARTPAERQAAYRKNRPTAGENGERRINIWVTTAAALALVRLASRYGVTHRDMLERLIVTADREHVAALTGIRRTVRPNSPLRGAVARYGAWTSRGTSMRGRSNQFSDETVGCGAAQEQVRA